MTDDQAVDFFNYDYEGVEATQNFVPAKAGTYALKVDEIEVGPRSKVEGIDGDERLIVKLRHSFVNTDGIETVGKGVLGGIFNRLWLHTPKAFPFLRALVEAHGGTWAEFTAGIKAQAGRDIGEVLGELLTQYVGSGTTCEAKVKLVTKNQHGEDLTNPRNEIAKYIVPVSN